MANQRQQGFIPVIQFWKYDESSMGSRRWCYLINRWFREYWISNDNVVHVWCMTTGRLGSADASDGHVDHFCRNNKFELRIKVGNFQWWDERHATGGWWRMRTRRRFAETVSPKDDIRNSKRIGVALDFKWTESPSVELGGAGVWSTLTPLIELWFGCLTANPSHPRTAGSAVGLSSVIWITKRTGRCDGDEIDDNQQRPLSFLFHPLG